MGAVHVGRGGGGQGPCMLRGGWGLYMLCHCKGGYVCLCNFVNYVHKVCVSVIVVVCICVVTVVRVKVVVVGVAVSICL